MLLRAFAALAAERPALKLTFAGPSDKPINLDGRSLTRAIRVAGKVEPIFVEEVAQMPEAIMDAAQDGDVVITMGAGSIGSVPGRLANRED